MQLTGQDISLFLAAASAGGLGVFVVAAALKKLFGSHFDQDIHTIVVVLSLVAAGAQYLTQIQATLPPYIMGVSMVSVYGVSQLIYKLSQWLTSFAGNVKATVDTAAIQTPNPIPPAPVLPPSATPTTPADTSIPSEATF